MGREKILLCRKEFLFFKNRSLIKFKPDNPLSLLEPSLHPLPLLPVCGRIEAGGIRCGRERNTRLTWKKNARNVSGSLTRYSRSDREI